MARDTPHAIEAARRRGSFILDPGCCVASSARIAIIGQEWGDPDGAWDSSPYRNEASTLGAATWHWSNELGRPYMSTSTSSDNIVIPHDASMNLSSELTVALWCRLPTLESGWNTLAAKRSNGNVANFGMNYNGGGPNLFQWYFTDGAANFKILSVSASATLPADEWFHICGILKDTGADVYAEVFVNGVSKASTTHTTTNIDTNSVTASLGFIEDKTSGKEEARMDVADFFLLDRAASASEAEVMARRDFVMIRPFTGRRVNPPAAAAGTILPQMLQHNHFSGGLAL